MELKSNKYKKRLAIICVILIISSILGNIAEKEVKKYSDQVDKVAETIQATPEEEYEKRIEEKKENEGANISTYLTKEEALENVKKWQDFYGQIFRFSEIYVKIIFTIAISGSIIGIMIYYIFTGYILNKIWPDMKSWMSITMRILVFILLFKFIYQIITTIGVFGQLPFVIYTFYKFIKTRREENKDDMIKEK